MNIISRKYGMQMCAGSISERKREGGGRVGATRSTIGENKSYSYIFPGERDVCV
jgi:hypothetical protein